MRKPLTPGRGAIRNDSRCNSRRSLAQDDPDAVILTEEEFQAVLTGGGSIPVGTILTDEQFERFAARIAAEVEQEDELRQALVGMLLAVTDDLEEVQQGAEQGHATGQFRLGVMYDNGEGGLKDSALAHMWSNITGANGNASARELRDSLERDMTRAEISRATKLARACMASDYQDCEP